MKRVALGLVLLLLAACAPAVEQTLPPGVLVYASPAAQPWLIDLYDCAARQAIPPILIRVDAPDAAEIALRVGAPAYIPGQAFEVGREEVLVVVNGASALQALSLAEAQALFSAQGNVPLWVYGPDVDIEQVFEQQVTGSLLSVGNARVAASPREVAAALGQDSAAIGFLPRRWKTDELRVVYTLESVPVLALTPAEPDARLRVLLACLASGAP